jgi:hypothetical protein
MTGQGTLKRRQEAMLLKQLRKGHRKKMAKIRKVVARVVQPKPEPKPKVQRQPFRDLPAETLDKMEAILYRVSKRKMRIA